MKSVAPIDEIDIFIRLNKIPGKDTRTFYIREWDGSPCVSFKYVCINPEERTQYVYGWSVKNEKDTDVKSVGENIVRARKNIARARWECPRNIDDRLVILNKPMPAREVQRQIVQHFMAMFERKYPSKSMQNRLDHLHDLIILQFYSKSNHISQGTPEVTMETLRTDEK